MCVPEVQPSIDLLAGGRQDSSPFPCPEKLAFRLPASLWSGSPACSGEYLFSFFILFHTLAFKV